MLANTAEADTSGLDILVDIDAMPIAPFEPEEGGFWRQLTLKINKQRWVRGKRFWARALCRFVPPIARVQYDIENGSGLRARVALDNFHDYWLADRRPDLEADYRACVQRMLLESSQQDFTYVDIGGNTGIVAALTLKDLQEALPSRNLTCVVVEPQSDLITRLATNLRWNAEDATVKLFHCALGDRFGAISMKINRNNRGGSRIGPDSLFSKKVNLVTLAHVVERAGLKKIDLLKIDVEGREYEILNSYLSACDRSLLPRYIFVEVNRDRTTGIMKLLTDAGYACLWRDDEDAFLRLRDV